MTRENKNKKGYRNERKIGLFEYVGNLISSRLIETMNPIHGIYYVFMNDKKKSHLLLCLFNGNIHSF